MNKKNSFELTNRILLGLVMLIPGLMKIFSIGVDNIGGMLMGMGIPAPTFFAWVLTLSEIVFGIAILASWKLEYTKYVPSFILVIAALTFWMYGPGAQNGAPNWTQIFVHIALASNYLILGTKNNN